MLLAIGPVGVEVAVAPRLSQVYVGSTAWTPSFRQFIGQHGFGSARYGYAVGAGSLQLDELPWCNLDRISLTFDSDVNVGRGDLVLHGTGIAANNAFTDFAYDANAHTATWTLAHPLAGEVQLALDADRVTGTAVGGPFHLDGEWGGERVIASASTPGSSRPGLAFDLLVASDGRVYYIDHFGNELGALDTVTGRRTALLTGLRSPYHMVEVGGRIYFTEFGTGEGEYADGALSVYDPASSGHTRLRDGLDAPGAIDADAAGNLYVLEVRGTSTVFGGADRLLKFSPGSGDYEVLIGNANSVHPLALLLDPRRGVLYIGNWGSYSPSDEGELIEYSLATARLRTVVAGLPTVWDMEFDHHGNIVVAGFGADGGSLRAVSYVPGTLDRVVPLRTGLHAWTVAPASDGSIYFATGRSDQSIRVLEPGRHSYPSGDGAPGGDFRFHLSALPGDVNRDGAVLADDFSEVKRRFFATADAPGFGNYSPFLDVNGDGVILAGDFSEVKKQFFQTAMRRADADAPVVAPAGSPAARPVRLKLFADRPVLW